MPVPGVPTLQPVNQPEIAPGEAGHAGAIISGFAEGVEGIAQEALGLQAHIRKAQEHVDKLAARNELDAAYTQLQNDLAKTQNSRDVQGVLVSAQEHLNDISKRWANSPAALEIQMDAESLRPGMGHISEMRQIDLLGKEFKVTLNHQGEVFGKDYAAARGVGDSAREKQALDGFTDAVKGGVQTGLMGDVEAEDTIRLFRERGQELEIKNAIASPDPNANQAIFDKMNSDPQNFPDVKPEFIASAKERAMDAKESHIKHQEWADQEMVKRGIVPKIISDNTDADGSFNLVTALKQASALPPGQEEIATKLLEGHDDNANANLKGELNKASDSIEDAIRHNKFNEAAHIADQARFKSEKAGLPWFATESKRIDAARREAQSTWRAEWGFEERQRKVDEDQASQGRAFQILPDVLSGRMNEQQLAANLGPGKLSYKNYLQLSNLAKKVQNEPDTKQALGVLYDSIPPPPKTASPGDQLEYDNLRWNLYEAWQQGVAEKGLKGDEKSKYAAELVKPFVTQDTANRLDKLFGGGKPQTPADSGSWLVRGKGQSWSDWLSHRMGLDTPKEGTTKKNSSGDPIVFKGGQWRPAP